MSRSFPQQGGPAGSFLASPGCLGDRGTVTVRLAFAARFRVHSWSSEPVTGQAIRVHRCRLRLSNPPWVTAGPVPGGPGGVGDAAWSRSHGLPLGLHERLLAPGRMLFCPCPAGNEECPVSLLRVINACPLRQVQAGSLLFTRSPQNVRSKNLGRIKFVCKLLLFGVTCGASVAPWTWLGWGGGEGLAGGTRWATSGGSGTRRPGPRSLTRGPRRGTRFL